VSENQTIESPDFLKIKDESGYATSDAVRLLWYVLNDEAATRRRSVRAAQERLEPAVKTAAPTANQDNYPTDGASIIYFNGSTNVSISGIMAPEPGKARILLIHVGGTGTITFLNASASSITENRIVTSTGADRARATNTSLMLAYLDSRWRDIAL
jgi:hypothetical protein